MRYDVSINFQMDVERDAEGYYVHSPDLEGLHTDGPTEWDAVCNGIDGATLIINCMLLHDEDVGGLCTIRKAADAA